MSKRNLIWLVVIAAVAIGFYQLVLVAAQKDEVYRTYSPLVEVDALIRQRYVEPIEDDGLVDGAVRGMMFKLDPYSGYIGPDELDAYRRRAAGEYQGLGVHLGIREGQLTVIAPVEQSPAVEAGVRAGDVILAIDGQSTKGLSVADAQHLLAGNPGGSVELTVRHEATGGVETLRVTRAPIRLQSVKGYRKLGPAKWDYLADPNYGLAYVRVSNFHENTAAEFDQVLDDLRGWRVRGLVLDLRFNPGGSLAAAVAMVDRFLADGLIVATVTRHQAVDRYEARPEGTFPPVAIAVLVNGYSASASEIVAGSLQDHTRAIVVGSRSFGKGVVQTVIELTGHRAAVSLTVAHYRLPSGRIIHRTPQNITTDDWGVLPDRNVPLTPEQELAITERRAELDRLGPETTTSPVNGDNQPTVEIPSVLIDGQLAAALNALREQIPQPPAGGDPTRHNNTAEPTNR